jgi:8-oxo-dGTP pyrophosphatase MutT (NUDIX family)
MAYERSAGIVVYREEKGDRLYLLLNYPQGHWDFPKGHIEGTESEKEAAIRETREETGLSDIELTEGFMEKVEYFYYRGGEKSFKEVIFFVGRTSLEDVRISHEHIGYKWLKFDQAFDRLTFQSAKDLLKNANRQSRNGTNGQYYK